MRMAFILPDTTICSANNARLFACELEIVSLIIVW